MKKMKKSIKDAMKAKNIIRIKRAMLEIRRICQSNYVCSLCPLAVNGKCPMVDKFGDRTAPCYWVLDDDAIDDKGSNEHETD